MRTRANLKLLWTLLAFLNALILCQDHSLADDQSLNLVLEEITSAKARGRPFLLLDYYAIRHKPEINLTSAESVQAWWALKASQQPIISNQKLAELFESKKAGLKSLSYGQTFEYGNDIAYPLYDFMPQSNRVRLLETEFALSGQKIAYRTVSRRVGWERIRTRHLAFDGKHKRELVQSLEGTNIGTVSELAIRQGFVPTDFRPTRGLLTVTGLLSADQFGYGNMPSVDAQLLASKEATIVFETTEEKFGDSVLCMSDGASAFYLSLDKDFSLVAMESYRIMNEEWWGVRELTSRLLNSPLRDFGSGLWLPTETVAQHFEDGKIVCTDKYTFTDLAVNETIPDQVFTDIFPIGTHVRDKTANINYVEGGP